MAIKRSSLNLDSTSYVTKAEGNISQYIAYMPSEMCSTNSIAVVNKCRICLTQKNWILYYYGARYYDPRISLWLSVDPLAEQTMTSYAYVNQNPVRFIDPDGRGPLDIIILTSNGSFKASQALLYETAEGKRIWDKYGKSKTEDVYIYMEFFEANSTTVGVTYPDLQETNFIKDGELDMNGLIGVTTVKDVNVSNSEGRRIHLISLNTDFFKENNNNGDYTNLVGTKFGNYKICYIEN